jgi:hypothetical protein
LDQTAMSAKNSFLSRTRKISENRRAPRFAAASVLLLSYLTASNLTFAQSCGENQHDATKCVKQIASFSLTRVFMFSEVKGMVYEFENECEENLRVVALFGSGKTRSASLSAKSSIPEGDRARFGSIFCEADGKCEAIRWIACSARAVRSPDADEKSPPAIAEPPQQSVQTTKEVEAKEVDLTPEISSVEAAKPDATASPQAQSKDSATSTRPTFVMRENWDLTGQDLRILSGVNADECKEACRVDGECVGFTSDRWNRYCFLKSNVRGLRLEPKALSGWREGANSPEPSNSERVFEPYRKRRFSGAIMDSKVVETLGLCQSSCSDDQCIGFSFANNSRQCSRFSKIGGYYSDDGVVSGAKRQIQVSGR